MNSGSEKERERDQLSSNFKVDGKIEREVLIKGGNDRLIVSRRNESQMVDLIFQRFPLPGVGRNPSWK